MEPLASIDDLNRYLQRTVDADAGALALASASGLVRDYCGWPISREETTFVLDGDGTTLLGLPTLELVAVNEVRAAGEVLTGATGWPPRPGEYTWSRNGQLQRGAGWPAGFRTCEADVIHGYDVTPDVVRGVVLALAAVSSFNPGDTLVSKTVGAVTHVYRPSSDVLGMTRLPRSLALQLNDYRLP